MVSLPFPVSFFLRPRLALFPLACWLFGSLAVSASTESKLRLPALFSDHAVLSRSPATPVWGWAPAGSRISVSLASNRASTQVASDGRWQVELDLSAAPREPGTLVVTVQGGETRNVSDVLVGEVWLASGQSNMEWALSNTLEAAEELPRAADAHLRYFVVPNLVAIAPTEDVAGKWVLSSPSTAGRFSAVAYAFARRLRTALNQPVGIIDAAWGGTPAEAWMSRESLDADPDLRAGRERSWDHTDGYPQRRAAYASALETWIRAAGRELGNSSKPAGEWQPVSLPLTGDGTGGWPESGVLWLSRTVEITEANRARARKIEFRDLEGFETVYWDDRKIGELTVAQAPGLGARRSYDLPTDLLQPGAHALTIRLHAPLEGWKLGAAPKIGDDTLGQGWRAAVERVYPPRAATDAPPPAAPRALMPWPEVACRLYNGMIHPLAPFAIRGVIWYQGESNTDRAAQYATTFPRLIEDWRRRWSQPQLPFYFCQLSGFQPKSANPGESTWAELREAQHRTALTVPATGQAVIFDLGDTADIHPRRKREVGERLARVALHQTYQQELPWTGPVFTHAQAQDDTVVLTFATEGSPLVALPLPESYSVRSANGETAPLVRRAPAGELEGFAICGEDRRWVWAEARITGPTTLVVRSPEVPRPVAVRYAWADNPNGNLGNDAGLLAPPFRTDDFPLTTAGKQF